MKFTYSHKVMNVNEKNELQPELDGSYNLNGTIVTEKVNIVKVDKKLKPSSSWGSSNHYVYHAILSDGRNIRIESGVFHRAIKSGCEYIGTGSINGR